MQFIMAQLLQKEEVSGVQQNPNTVPTETLPVLSVWTSSASCGGRWHLGPSVGGAAAEPPRLLMSQLISVDGQST